MKTAVILVTYNGWDLTQACLRCLEPLLCDDFLVAIADNASSDKTVFQIRKKFPWVHLYEMKSNCGFGAANNAAVRKLTEEGFDFDSICFLNNDTTFEPGTLITLRNSLNEYQKNTGKAAVFTPTVQNTDGTRQKNYYANISLIQFMLNAFRSTESAGKRLHGTPTPQKESTLLETYRTNAVCWMFPSSLWKKSGGFDEHIFMYYEDTDWAWRARKAGISFFIETRAILTHLGGGSAKSTPSHAKQHDVSQEYFFYKHYGLLGKFISMKFRFLRSFSRLILLSLLYPWMPKVRESWKIHFQLLMLIFKRGHS